jgi:hypothetical protein
MGFARAQPILRATGCASSLPGLTRQSMVRFGYRACVGRSRTWRLSMDARVKPGHDGGESRVYNALLLSFTTAA